MKQTITQSEFIDQFHTYGRSDNFTYGGLIALYDYLEELGDDMGEDIELDVIALCCEFSQFTLEELGDSYGYMFEGYEDWDLEDWADNLRDYTQVIMWDDCNELIIGEF